MALAAIPIDNSRLRLRLRKARRALAEWLRALWALVRPPIFAGAGAVVILGLPAYAFVGEGPGAAKMQSAAVDFYSAISEAAAAAPSLAFGALFAVGLSAWQIFRRFVSKAQIPAIMDIQRDYLGEYEEDFEINIIRPLRGSALTTKGYELVADKANELLIKICTRLVESFELLTGGKCCASIKLFDAKKGTVSTRARGLEQYYKRKRADEALPAFPYKDNSAFSDIVDGHCSFYRSNWLPFWWLIGWYKNANSNWLKLYAATIVLPILARDKSIIGFMCVDNISGRFPRTLSRPILESYATAARNLLVILGRIRQQ